ncbi:uncharacterized protein [Eucyclogobius newberryi]|uniref:uncharacterized protein n=1 Tax=Eucyclogobius newberryi TaxID=166745 RepID=UPI003B5C5393
MDLLETEHFELMEKEVREEENTARVDQLTKQVASLQAALQAAEEGFKNENEVMQRDFQELKHMYEHNTQRLLEELRKNEALKEERQKTKENEKEITNNLDLNFPNLELEHPNNKELMEKLNRKEDTELVDQLTKQVASLQAALQTAEEGLKKEKEVTQRHFQELKDSYEKNTQRLLEEQRENEALKEERQKTDEYVKEITKNLEFNLQSLELERLNNKELMEALKRKEEDTELVDQLTKQVASLQAALQTAEEGLKKEKEVTQRHFQELKDSYEKNTQRLLEEQKENEALEEERQKTDKYVKAITKNLEFNLQSLELERLNNKELMEKLKRKEENTELVDQMTKQVAASLQAALQTAEEGFKKEKEMIQRDFQELKDSYEKNTQLLLKEQKEIEAMKEERQKTDEYVKEVTKKVRFDLPNLELERLNNKELMEKLTRKENNAELVDQLTKQVASLHAALQTGEEGFKKKKEKSEKDLQGPRRLFIEQTENVVLMKKRQESKAYIERLCFNMQHLKQSTKLMENWF